MNSKRKWGIDMKKPIALIVCAVTIAVFAQLKFNYQKGERSTDLIPTEMGSVAKAMLGENADALLHALRLQMSKYDLDMTTRSGRGSWHGKYIGEEIDTNTLEKVEIYSNTVSGAVWRYKMPFSKPSNRPVSSRPKYTFRTNGVPTSLAEARVRAAKELNDGPVVTNIVITNERNR